MLRDHLPAVLRALHRTHPTLRLQLRSGYQSEFDSWLLDREIDLAVTALDTRPAPGMSRLPLPHRNVRALPLDDFPIVEIVALWLGRPTPVVTAALDAMRTYATARWPTAARLPMAVPTSVPESQAPSPRKNRPDPRSPIPRPRRWSRLSRSKS